MLNVIVLSVIKLSVTVLTVASPLSQLNTFHTKS
jgi:hypothetical protein